MLAFWDQTLQKYIQQKEIPKLYSKGFQVERGDIASDHGATGKGVAERELIFFLDSSALFLHLQFEFKEREACSISGPVNSGQGEVCEGGASRWTGAATANPRKSPTAAARETL